MLTTETGGIPRMKTGLLERILTRRYGPPLSCIRDGMAAKSWNYAHPDDEAVLYMGMTWKGRPGLYYASLQDIYGDAYGGILIKNTLRAAVLVPRHLFAVWDIDELRELPAVQHALVMDPAIDYFMDAYNVYYYGIKAGDLYVFDAEMDELDCLGPIESAIETLMDEFEAAGEEVSRSSDSLRTEIKGE
jgi:hypothetical protein